MGQQGFWDFETRHQKLESKKDLLVSLNEMIRWDEFRPILESVYAKPCKSKAGRPPIDVIVMFKLLILQQLYNIGDDELEGALWYYLASPRTTRCAHIASQ
ncbi:protein of unknown function DUF772 with transposase domain [Leptolyngbya sp. PCC 7375]|nr:protein of unknown function DUF772 with transposase domain [Leptolyngbya sp. PCC 7375]